jgi:hypothetical protein
MTLASDTYFKKGVNIQVFIGHMQRNFILTDVMKTGFHQDLENFISMHSMTDQSFDMTGEYYTLQWYDLDSYDRKFAIIDIRWENARFSNNKEFYAEIYRRLHILKSQGFVFIKASPWESLHNIDGGSPRGDGKGPIEFYPDIDVEHIKWTGGVSWFWYYMYNKHKDKSFNFVHDNKKYDFLYLNKGSRSHRQRLIEKVEPLMQNSLFTDWPNKKLPLEYELPWAQEYPKHGMDQDIYEKPYNDTKYSLVSETNDVANEVFMTEKIWKAIIAKHVFVVHGNYLYLQKLRELGFKTFGSYIDESYDLELHRGKKIDQISDVCKKLISMNWQDLYLQTKALRQHNHDLFFDRNKLSAEINKTLDLFLEFADTGQVPS